MAKFNQMLPEMRLDSDIYLAKWLKHIQNPKGPNPFSILTVSPPTAATLALIKTSDLEQLSRKVEVSHLRKIRPLFVSNSPVYFSLLTSQLQFRTVQQEMIKEFMVKAGQNESKEERDAR